MSCAVSLLKFEGNSEVLVTVVLNMDGLHGVVFSFNKSDPFRVGNVTLIGAVLGISVSPASGSPPTRCDLGVRGLDRRGSVVRRLIEVQVAIIVAGKLEAEVSSSRSLEVAGNFTASSVQSVLESLSLRD
jgi:hypothetical protein